MGTRINRIYNNPQIGVAMSNLAAMFEPPAPQDVMAYAQAAKINAENERLSGLYAQAGNPNVDTAVFDRQAAIAGAYNPTQGFGARDMGDATQRYGYDTSASTSRANNAATNATAARGQDLTHKAATFSTQADLLASLSGPVAQNAARPAMPAALMEGFGLPGIAGFQGPRSAPSPTDIQGQQLQEAVERGYYGPQDAANTARSDMSVEQIVAADGLPVNVNRADAVGEQPYINPGSTAGKKFATYKTPSGEVGTAVLDPVTGAATDQATGQPLPAGVITGDVTDTGGGALTTGTSGDFQKRAFALTGALTTLDSLSGLIQSSPSSQGLVGSVRGTAQDMMQTGNEMGRAFGGTIAEVNDAVANGMLDAGVASQMYDPNIPAIDMLMNMLAWQYAKSMGGDRVSNEQLRMARAAIGDSGVFANQASSLTRLGQLKTMLTEEGRRLLPHLGGSLQSDLDVRLGPSPGAPAVSNAPTAGPQVGVIMEGHEFLGGDPSLPQSWRKVQ